MTHQMRRVKPSGVQFDHSYQRVPVRAHLARLVEQYDPTLVGALVVSRREAGDFVIDGQHRVLAAIEAGQGDVAMDAVVHVGLTTSDEAALFLQLNRQRKPVTRVSEWGAALVAGDPSVVAQANAIERAGWRVNPTSGAAGQISAVKALARLRALDVYGSRDLTYAVLTVLTSAWGNGKEVANGHLLEGAGLLFARFGDEIDRDALARKLKASGTATDMLGKASSHRRVLGGTMANAVGSVMHAQYNSKRGTTKLAAW